jgi:methionyl-tRNA formyltransferase
MTSQGVIQLRCIQLAGKKATPIEEFLHGRPEFASAHLAPEPEL